MSPNRAISSDRSSLSSPHAAARPLTILSTSLTDLQLRCVAQAAFDLTDAHLWSVLDLAAQEPKHEIIHHLKAVRDPIVESTLPHVRVPLQSVHVDQNFRVAAQECKIGSRENAAAVPNLVLLGRF